jgi:hypothetical protein
MELTPEFLLSQLKEIYSSFDKHIEAKNSTTATADREEVQDKMQELRSPALKKYPNLATWKNAHIALFGSLDNEIEKVEIDKLYAIESGLKELVKNIHTHLWLQASGNKVVATTIGKSELAQMKEKARNILGVLDMLQITPPTPPATFFETRKRRTKEEIAEAEKAEAAKVAADIVATATPVVIAETEVKTEEKV